VSRRFPARRLLNIVLHPHHHLFNPWKFACNICGKRWGFVCDLPQDRYIRKCVYCRSVPKLRAIVQAIEDYSGKSLHQHILDRAEVYEFTTTSAICRRYLGRPHYTCSGYFWDKPFGVELRPGVWNQDCQRLSFPDARFDIVISSEIMEHVRNPWLGFREIRRVLKPGGIHVFTIPYREDRLTTPRVDISGEHDVYLLPKQYHLDPYRTEDSLVYTDFGRDLPDLLRPLHFDTTLLRVQHTTFDIQDDLRPVTVFVSKAVEHADPDRRASTR